MASDVATSSSPVILIVDDEPNVLQLLCMQLHGQGYSIVTASTAEAALARCIEDKPDLLLLDLFLPAMNGIELAQKLKQDPATALIPIIMITASEERNTRLTALQAGVEDFLTKPVDRAELIARVRNMLRLKVYQNDLTRHNERLEQEVAARTGTLIKQQEKISRLTRIHAVLSGINSAIVRIHDRQRLLDEACRIAVSQAAFKSAWIGMIDPVTLEGKVVAAEGNGNGYLDKVLLTSAPDRPYSDRPVCRALRERRAVVCQDISLEPALADVCTELIATEHRSMAAFPLIVDGCAVGVLALYAGETGFFDKQELKLLNELAGDIAFGLQYIAKEERLHHLAFYDSLTGLPNRAFFLEQVARSINRIQGTNEQFVVVMGDIPRFRLINETFGRNAGDALLKEAGVRLSRLSRNPANLARVSSACFASMLEKTDDLTDAAQWIEHVICEATREPMFFNDEELTVSISAGIAVYPNDGETAEELCRRAEAAMMQAKASGELYHFYEPSINERVAISLRMENRLRRAIEHGEFVLHYQPKVDAHTMATVGLEALIRWNDPDLGMIPPIRFISVLEETGLIVPVGAWAIRQALADYRRLSEQGIRPPRIAVNVSIQQIKDEQFVQTVADAIATAQVPAHALEIEITESLLMKDTDHTIAVLREIRKMGVSIAIDDFGTGYSSLSYLAKLPLDTLKIDRSFIGDMSNSKESMVIVSSVISLAQALGLNVIAEGVEDEGQARSLRSLKCDEMQGYHFSRPQPFDAIVDYLLGRPAVSVSHP